MTISQSGNKTTNNNNPEAVFSIFGCFDDEMKETHVDNNQSPAARVQHALNLLQCSGLLD